LIHPLNRESTIKKLIEQFHINVIERRIFIDNPLKLSEIKAYVNKALETSKYVPAIAESGGLEGFYIEKTPTAILLHGRDYHGFINSKKYDSVDDAVEVYIKKEWGTAIDGINLLID
jgi:serine kinase of HPr protein (carbohydrate metabolism regulator)